MSQTTDGDLERAATKRHPAIDLEHVTRDLVQVALVRHRQLEHVNNDVSRPLPSVSTYVEVEALAEGSWSAEIDPAGFKRCAGPLCTCH
jgi:hypothetical protein